MARTAIITHLQMLEHTHGPGHPERPERLSTILETLEKQDITNNTLQLTSTLAPLETLTLIHDIEHVDKICNLSKMQQLVPITPDTTVSPTTFDAARLASGAVQQLVDSLVADQVDNGFCAVRPPGHHAERNQAMGFCYFNHIAIGARYAQQHGFAKIAIIDWDVHHGNGTQHSFEKDPNIFFFSVHQSPHYPGTGMSQEQGVGPGLGATLNVPVRQGCDDKDYLDIFRNTLRPALDHFNPDLIMLSAGFDAHRADPLGGIMLTEQGYADLTREVLEMANLYCQGRLISVLEGGYDLEATATSVAAHVRELMEF
tara:strand:+ start:779 stop:1720 length:942 start_codon:yes stop_codon:yes gene_type:complete